MKIVKVDGVVYLGAINSNVISDAIVSRNGLEAPVSARVVADYLITKNKEELLTIQISHNSSVATRELSKVELQLFATAEVTMDIARITALSNLENKEFVDKFLGKI